MRYLYFDKIYVIELYIFAYISNKIARIYKNISITKLVIIIHVFMENM